MNDYRAFDEELGRWVTGAAARAILIGEVRRILINTRPGDTAARYGQLNGLTPAQVLVVREAAMRQLLELEAESTADRRRAAIHIVSGGTA